MIPRYLGACAGALCVTLGLLLLMQSLIAAGGQRPTDTLERHSIEFVRSKRNLEADERRRELPEPVAAAKEPPAPPPLETARRAPELGSLDATAVLGAPDLRLAGGLELGGAPQDSEAIPLLQIPPTYPLRARERGIEGWVLVEFTIGPSGTVEAAAVVEADPPRVFDSAALRAIRKWKFKPQVEGGVAVAKSGMRQMITFELQDDDASPASRRR